MPAPGFSIRPVAALAAALLVLAASAVALGDKRDARAHARAPAAPSDAENPRIAAAAVPIWRAADARRAAVDRLDAQALRDHIEAAGWVLVVGKGRETSSTLVSTSDLTAARPPGVDGTVVLYRFENEAFLERVLPFVRAEKDLVYARGDRTLVTAVVRKNEAVARELLHAALGRPPAE